jgi:hypothetical protein
MDFTTQFSNQFQSEINYFETDIDLNKKLQDTRHALQESISENDQLREIITQLYSETRVENVATGELLSEIGQPIFRNLPLPRNADDLPVSERAGYVAFYLKFLGYSTRKVTEEYHKTKEHLESMHKSVRSNTVELSIKRTGSLKVPELDGQQELKRNTKATTPISPPITPPEQKKVISESRQSIRSHK